MSGGVTDEEVGVVGVRGAAEVGDDPPRRLLGAPGDLPVHLHPVHRTFPLTRLDQEHLRLAYKQVQQSRLQIRYPTVITLCVILH